MKLNIKQVILIGVVFTLVISLAAFSNQSAFGQFIVKVKVCHNNETLVINDPNKLINHLSHGDGYGVCTNYHEVYTGDGPPPSKLGQNGDLYFNSFDKDSLKYYVKIGTQNWELRDALIQPANICETTDILKFNQTDNKWKCEKDLFEDADADAGNELQKLSVQGNQITLDQGGGTIFIEDGDSDSSNEIQELRIATNLSPIYFLAAQGSLSDTIDCDAGSIASGVNILWVSRNGNPEFSNTIFNGGTASFTVNEISTLDQVEFNVEVTCIELGP